MAEPRLRILQGEIQGVKRRTINGSLCYSFMGIPYAEPPLGHLRFKAPVPIKEWSGIKDCTKHGNISIQIDELTNEVIGNEDCLFLNVHTPRLPSKENTNLYPVVVYIHFGAFSVGNGNSSMLGPDLFIENDIVFVSMNYRLGALGFLCLYTKEAPGNAGMKDQNLALGWIKQNISRFGGDPSDVTIMGASAGAASVEYHMLSPMSRGLFHKAIMTSGSALNFFSRSRDPLELALEIATSIGFTGKSLEELTQFYANVDAKKLAILNTPFSLRNKKTEELYDFNPVLEIAIDGVEPFMIMEPLELLKAGKFAKVPTITGLTEKEAIGFKLNFGDSVKEITNHQFLNCLPNQIGGNDPSTNDRLKLIYRPRDFNEDDLVNNFLSDVVVIGGCYVSLKTRSNFYKNNYFYVFTHDSVVNYTKALFDLKEKGACHGDELSYLAIADHVDEGKFTADDKIVRKRMLQMWTSFIKIGDPNPQQSELVNKKWLPTSSGNMSYLEIGKELMMKENPWPERMSLWMELYN